MILFTSYLSKCREPCCHQTDLAHRLIVPCSGERFPVRHKEFPVFAGTGNWLQAAEFAWRSAPKTVQRDENRVKFPKIPCYFPCCQGITTRAVDSLSPGGRAP